MGTEEVDIVQDYNQQVRSNNSEVVLSSKSSKQIKGKIRYLREQKELTFAKLSVVDEDLISEMLL